MITILLIVIFLPYSLSASFISGRYTLNNSQCAGFFFKKNIAYWYDELTCKASTWRIKELKQNIFMLIENDATKSKHLCPPRVFIYQILKRTKHQLILKEFWTGWSVYPNSILTFYKK